MHAPATRWLQAHAFQLLGAACSCHVYGALMALGTLQLKKLAQKQCMLPTVCLLPRHDCAPTHECLDATIALFLAAATKGLDKLLIHFGCFLFLSL